MHHYTFLKASPLIQRRERRAMCFVIGWGVLNLIALLTTIQ